MAALRKRSLLRNKMSLVLGMFVFVEVGVFDLVGLD